MPTPFGPGTGGEVEYRAIDRLTLSKPEEAWSRLLRVTAATDEAGLYWIADLLEDLIFHHGRAFVAMLEPELAINGRLRQAFINVVPMAPDDQPLEDRLVDLRDAMERELGAI